MKSLSVLLTLGLVAIAASGALCNTALDQDFFPAGVSPSIWTIVGDEGDWASNACVAQSFLAGASGNLKTIEFPIWEVWMSSPPQITWSITTMTSGGYPQGTALASGITTTPIDTSSPIVISIADNQNVAIVKGQQLAVCLSVARLPANTGMGCEIAGSDLTFWRPGYAGGSIFYRSSTGNWVRQSGCDLFFRSYVDVVPEPSSLLALICGVGGMIGGILKRRK